MGWRAVGLLILLLAGCSERGSPPRAVPPPGPTSAELRQRMVDRIRSRGVTDPRVLGALLSVPRHRFVRPDRAREAYGPEPLPIGEDQTISSPYVVALMTGLLSLDGDEKVLEIGTGSGYQAAVLSCLVPRVFTIEIRETLATAARERLAALGYDQVRVRCGDGYRGWPEEAPFDAIVVTAAPPSIPATLVDQLAPGGRMVVPVGGTQGNQTLTLLTKDAAGKVSRRTVTAVYFVPMIREK